MVPWTHPSQPQTASRSVYPFLQQGSRTSPAHTHRPSDHATPCSNSPHRRILKRTEWQVGDKVCRQNSLTTCYPHMPIGKGDISVTVCVFLVCTVTDKASGVKFFTMVHRRPRQGISRFCELCSPEVQNRTNRRACERRRMFQLVTPRP